MASEPARLVDAFAALRVLVIGEAMLDRYLEGHTGALCREAPVPVVTVARTRDVPGGAANTAANAASLGARTTLLSVVGPDAEGAVLRGALAAGAVQTECVLARAPRRTLTKHRLIAAGQMLVRFDQGTTEPIDARSEAELIRLLGQLYPTADAVIVSDYAYGVLTPALIDALAALQRRAPRVLVVDARRLPAYRDVGATAVKPNYEEAVRLGGEPAIAGRGPRAEQVVAGGDRILAATGAQSAAVTLDADGAVILERGQPPYRTYSAPTRPSRATGAGDTFAAALALALAAGAPTPAAAELASAAAGVAVEQDVTACCAAADLRQRLSSDDKRVPDLPELAARVIAHRREGRRIVFTNGCFDILHRGHITYLSRAKALGDVLVVGVNSDASVHRLKGPRRPINAVEDRVQVLAALSCVDHIAVFDEDTPAALLGVVRPDVFVKGGDYTKAMLPEAEVVESLGGRVEILPYLEDRSTTRIIQRIRQAYADRAA
jgi:D-beta-D-heptose 7-phosphate kinase/D-beta-D-heptose 1-phosphate adenosyltransferase